MRVFMPRSFPVRQGSYRTKRIVMAPGGGRPTISPNCPLLGKKRAIISVLSCPCQDDNGRGRVRGGSWTNGDDKGDVLPRLFVSTSPIPLLHHPPFPRRQRLSISPQPAPCNPCFLLQVTHALLIGVAWIHSREPCSHQVPLERAIRELHVQVEERVDGMMRITYQGRTLTYQAIAARPARTPAPPKAHHPQRSVTPPRDHPWRKRLLPERGQHAATAITSTGHFYLGRKRTFLNWVDTAVSHTGLP